MKIAFVGKGGSGKSTVSGLFIKHLIAHNQRVLAIDADINQHLAGMVGAQLIPERALYYGDNASDVRTILRGSNELIESAKRFVKTTPPGTGSHLVRLEGDDPVLRNYAVEFADGNYFMHAGTYDPDGIGISCYHSNLAVVENVLSHTVLREGEWLVADMVAGTDAFAGALHIMFDAIFMVVEPTPESVAVFRQFASLADEAHVAGQVFAVGNKVMDDEDAAYLAEHLGDRLVASLPHSIELRKARQRGQGLDGLSAELDQQLEKLVHTAHSAHVEPAEQLRKLHAMHQRFATQGFTIAKHGDITGQVDSEFTFN
jgi:CO dehydrogenase maturation factor